MSKIQEHQDPYIVYTALFFLYLYKFHTHLKAKEGKVIRWEQKFDYTMH